MCQLAEALSPTYVDTFPKAVQSKERLRPVHDSITAKAHTLCCPFCEVYELEPFGHSSLRCASCGAFLTGTILETLLHILELPDAVGRHACECGHPEMRRLPDVVYWCPACGSEVLPT
jgi:ribosomal protein L37AE/L43A